MQFKLLIYFLFFYFTFTLLYSKKHETGIFIGNFNLISNIGKNIHTEIMPINWNNSTSKSIGFHYIHNINKQQNIKLDILFNNITFDNYKSMNYNIYKNKKINHNIITNIGINLNHYFWNIQNQPSTQIIPYIFGGIEIMTYQTTKHNYNYKLIDHVRKYTNTRSKNIKNYIVNINTFNCKTTLALKYGLGFQINFNKNWIFFTEFSLHPTFINDLDYNFNKNNKINYDINNNKLLSQSYLNIFIKKFQNDLQKQQIQNNFTNDWCIITGIGITYKFD